MASLHAFRFTLMPFFLLVADSWLINLFDPIRLLGWSNTAISLLLLNLFIDLEFYLEGGTINLYPQPYTSAFT